MRVPLVIAIILSIFAWGSSSCVDANAGGVIVRESRDPEPRAIPLKFRLDKSEWEDGYLHVWGEVKNHTDHDYDFVEVIFIALDSNHKLLGRADSFCEPQTLHRYTVGYLADVTVETQGQEPAFIEYRVIGFKASRH